MLRISQVVRIAVTVVGLSWWAGSALAPRSARAEDTGKTTGKTMAEGKAFWEHVLHLVDQYDPAVADLYADDAVIKNVIVDASGKRRESAMEPARFKALLRAQLPRLRDTGRHSTYSACKYALVAQGLRIECERRSGPQQPAHHVSVRVSKDKMGQWRVQEEISTLREQDRPSPSP